MMVNSRFCNWNHPRNQKHFYTTKEKQVQTPICDAIPSVHPTEIKKYLANQTNHKKRIFGKKKKQRIYLLNMNLPPGFCASFLLISSFSRSIRSASSCCFFNCCVSNISLSQKNGGVFRLGNASLCLP
jgi:hypothetical protein